LAYLTYYQNFTKSRGKIKFTILPKSCGKYVTLKIITNVNIIESDQNCGRVKNM